MDEHKLFFTNSERFTRYGPVYNTREIVTNSSNAHYEFGGLIDVENPVGRTKWE